MTFKELEYGYVVYIFDKQAITASEGKVIGKDGPKYDVKALTNDLVVDLTIEIGGQNKTYTFKSNTEVGYIDALSICTSKEILLREVNAKKAQEESVKSQIEQAVSQLDIHKDIIEKCTLLATDLDPNLKDKKEHEERMVKIEESIDEMRKLMQGIVTRIK